VCRAMFKARSIVSREGESSLLRSRTSSFSAVASALESLDSRGKSISSMGILAWTRSAASRTR